MNSTINILNDQQMILATRFLDVLQGEVHLHCEQLSWQINDSSVDIFCSNGYSASLTNIGAKSIMKNVQKEFIERDFEDGLVRMRFELIRSLNPKAFQ